MKTAFKNIALPLFQPLMDSTKTDTATMEVKFNTKGEFKLDYLTLQLINHQVQQRVSEIKQLNPSDRESKVDTNLFLLALL